METLRDVETEEVKIRKKIRNADIRRIAEVKETNEK